MRRNAGRSTEDFRELANGLGTLLAYEATAGLGSEPRTRPGWAGPVTVQRVAGAKITVVAEGIEQEAQYELLAQRGCDLGQGYWLSHPVTATEVVRMIDSGL